MFEDITADLKRYYILGGERHSSWKAKLHLLMFSYGLHALAVYRFGKYIEANRIFKSFSPIKYPMYMFYYVMNFIIKLFYGINIDKRAIIGKGFYIGHFGNINIGTCSIGKNCSVNHQTQIGKVSSYHNSRGIIIGDYVWIGAHSKILDDCKIGDHVTISGGSVVKSDIKPFTLVLGNPARNVLINYDNSHLL